VLETLDAAAVHRWCGGGLEALRAHQHEIDELNVYPVPDGDTGTNLVLTLAAAQEALDRFLSERPEPAGGVGEADRREAAGGPGEAERSAATGRVGEADRGEAVGDAERLAAMGGAGGAEHPEAFGGAGGSERSEAEGGAGDAEQLAEASATALGRAMRRMARGALLGARGNSGVIVSQILRGMADSFATSVAVRGGELARALRTATEAAYGAVARPVEGTVLSVVAAAADGAGRLKSDDLLAVAREAARSAHEALARTPQQLPALARAGVVDAGGRGLCVLLDALVEALGARTEADTRGSAEGDTRGSAEGDGGEPAEGDGRYRAEGSSGPGASGPGAVVGSGPFGSGAGAVDRAADGGEDGHRHEAVGEFGYEVQYLLDAADDAVGRLRTALDAMGDSLVVVGTGDGDPPTWNVHVHVPADRIGPAVEAGVAAGRPHRIEVTPLDDRIGEPAVGEIDRRGAVAAGGRDRPDAVLTSGDDRQGGVATGESGRRGAVAAGESGRRGAVAAGGGDRRGAVVVAAGDGLTALFEAEGAIVVGRNPSTAEMLAAITAAGAGSVVLLPNDANTHAVATAAAREAERAGLRVSVVPTRSPVQAVAALAVRDDGRAFADDVIAMAEAAGSCRYGEVCTAQRAAFTVAGPCRAGDLLGLVDGEVHVIGTDLEDVSRRLLDRMLGGGGELATLVLGADAPDGLDDVLREHVTRAWPFVELHSYAGGQPRYHLLVGVE
jgi:DAK2 domain fusion protein YloV